MYGKTGNIGKKTIQTLLYLEEFSREIPIGLTVCSVCVHLVPDTRFCLWCGAKLVEGSP